MKKYYLSDGIERFGPYSLKELRDMHLTGDTLVWYPELENWTKLSEIEELKSFIKTNDRKKSSRTKPHIPKSATTESYDTTQKSIINKIVHTIHKNKIALIIMGVIVVISAIYFINENQKEKKLYRLISSTAYDGEVDFDIYVKKFYRDLEVYGIYPMKPRISIIKFAELDQIPNTTHIHAISYGVNDDERIEIYINPSSWASFNKPMRYLVMYHELAHDVLNIDDLEESPSNEWKLMYPAIASYDRITMDDFIEMYHELFEEISEQQSY